MTNREADVVVALLRKATKGMHITEAGQLCHEMNAACDSHLTQIVGNIREPYSFTIKVERPIPEEELLEVHLDCPCGDYIVRIERKD